ncbi:MAG: hypothetical protein OCD01_16175 [Fibrobacterales bacterium]
MTQTWYEDEYIEEGSLQELAVPKGTKISDIDTELISFNKPIRLQCHIAL